MLLGTHRTAPTESKNCNRLYLRKPVTYTLAQTEDAINARLRFAAVSAAIKARKADLTKLTTDQQAFLAQKDSPNGKKTMKAYYWKICGDLYDEQHNG